MNSLNVRKFCEEEAERIRKIITEELRGKLVSLKIDSCTKGQRPFFAINIQFIKNKKVHIRTLNVKEMAHARQLAINLKREMEETAGEFGIPTPNIHSITCDSGGNMILSSKLIGDDQEMQVDLEDVLPGDEGIEDGCLLSAGDCRCQCVRCAAHTLQLSVEHGL